MLLKILARRLYSVATLVSVFCTLTMTGCLGGSEDQQSLSSSAAVSTITLLSYDNVNASINVKGNVNIPGTTQLTSVVLHYSNTCSDNSIGQGLLSAFPTTGINISVPSTKTVSLYLATTTFTGCYFLGNYTTPHDAPPVAVVTSLSPASPSRISTTPRIFGTQAGFASQIRFYSDTTCSTLIGGGLPADFPTIGIQLSVPANTTTNIYSKSIEAFGNSSACTKVSAYTHTTLGPNPPVFTSIAPVSPSQITTPMVVGTLPADAVSVTIFGDSSCSTQIGTGPAADFQSTGVLANVPENATTGIYAIAFDANANPSTCSYLTTFVNDTLPPAAPAFISASPASPTRLTIYPRIKGTSSSDTAQVKFYSDAGCLRVIGNGPKSEFENAGTIAGVYANDTTSIYGIAIDGAGNASTCTYLTSYYNNTIPPDAPVYSTTNPISPNNKSGTPYILGAPSSTTVSVQIYKDDQCTSLIGSGSAAAFQSPGIVATVPDNQDTVIYATGTDAEGNISTCTTLTTYRYSIRPAIAPAFVQMLPKSPSRSVTNPAILGTADKTISTVQLFRDAACTSSLATGTRGSFVTSGIQLSLYANTNNLIYAIAYDVYGNASACTFLTQYIHDNIAPYQPTYSSTSPTSPNNQSTTPLIFGSTTVRSGKVLPISKVHIYDSLACTNELGNGTPAAFAGAGIALQVPADTDSLIYGQTSDDAGNTSDCVSLTDYFHNTIKPGKPAFVSTTPKSPSYTQLTAVVGTIGITKSQMAPTSVVLYSDLNCQTILSQNTPAVWKSSGIMTTMPENASTSIYGSIFDPVGNTSGCTLLTSFFHNDIGPKNLTLSPNQDGSIALSWSPDTTASPTARYVVKRSIRSGGPYSILNASAASTSFNDTSVTNGVTYYYVVAATNNTGTSYDSIEQSIQVNAPTPSTAINLVATPGAETITLSWTGDGTDMTFTVLRANQSGGPYSTIAKNLSSTLYSDSPLTDGTIYYYVVKGANPSGSSVQSNEISAVPYAQPTNPINLSLALVNSVADCSGSRGVVLTWTAPPYYTRFAISRSQTSGATNIIQNSTITTNRWVDCNPADYPNSSTNINRNFYTVSAVWGSGMSAASNEVGMADNFISGLYAYPGNNNIQLLWNADSLSSNFTLLRATQSGGPYTVLASALTSSSYSDTTAANGTSYYYIVRDNYASSGSLYGWDSGEVAALPAATIAPPSNLNLTMNSNHQPVLDWVPPQNYNGFSIYRSTSAGGTYVLTGGTDRLLSTTPLTYTDSSVSNLSATRYYYKIATRWGSAESSMIGPVSFQAGTPSSLAVASTAASLNLTWSSITGASSYNILRSTSAGGPYTTLTSVTTNSYSDTSAAVATGYYYVINAVFSGTQGPNSNEASGMRTGTQVPSGLTVTATTGGSVTLQWTPVASATAYYIYKSTSAGGTFVKAAATTGTLTASVVGLSSNTKYWFTVSAVVGTEKAQSTSVVGYTTSAPIAPTLSVGPSSIGIQCSLISGASYDVQRSTTGQDASFTTIVSGLSNGATTDSSVSTGALYYYRCVANVSGISSMISPQAVAIAGLVAPAPGALVITQNTTGNSLTLTFAAVPGANYYRIYAGTSSGNYNLGFTPASPSLNGTVSATITGLSSGTVYYFVASSLIGSTESSMSAEFQGIPLATPTAPIAVVSGASTINISWSSVGNGVTDYSVLRSSDGVNYATVGTGLGTTTSYNDTSAVSGVPYTYVYLPYGSGHLPMATSSVSNTVSYGVAPIAPAGLTANSPSTTSVNLAWTQVPNISSYNIYRSTTSGSGYSLLSSVASLTTNYVDSTVTGGTTYYYIVRSVNAVQVESSNSNQAAVQLSSTITGVAAISSANGINISWNPSGATTYEVHRSRISSGPLASYGLIASGLTSPTYRDVNVKSGVTYYYLINGVYANNARTPNSAEASATALVTMNLQVPIELTDRGVSSDVAPVTFERTRTSLNTDDYDGTLSYNFEVIASNGDSASATVQLVDSSGTSVSTISVPAYTSGAKRFRATFTPTAGYNEYRLMLSATSSADTFIVQTARVLVNQTNATKTKLYIPLLATNDSPSHSDSTSIEFTNSTTYNQLSTTSIYRKNAAAFADLADQNAWEFEALASSTATTRASVTLYNVTQGDLVYDTQTPINSSSIGLIHAPFAEGTTNFATANDGDQIEATIRCEVNCAPGQGIALYKAGLWVRLTNLSKAQVLYRMARASATFSDTIFDNDRSLIDLSLFSNPTVNFLANGSVTPGDSATVRLLTAGSSDQGIPNSPTAISGSSLSFSNSTKSQVGTSTGITINSGDRFLLDATPASGTFKIIDGFIKIDAHPN